MDYAAFKELDKKPSGMSSELTADFVLDFSQDQASLLGILDD